MTREPADQLCASDLLNARESTIEQFAVHWGNYLFRQFLLAGWGAEGMKRALHEQSSTKKIPIWYQQKLALAGYDTLPQGQGLMDHVIDALPRLFSMVGLVEDFDKSSDFMHAMIPGLGEDKHTHEHSDHEEAAQLALEARSNNIVLQSLSADIAIYEAATELFRRQVRVNNTHKRSCD